MPRAELIYPAADLSEQISLAGKEASGTGNMKMALNGTVTIGTLDGANIEIRECVGADNFFLFGVTETEAVARREVGYRPRDHYDAESELRAALDAIAAGRFTAGDDARFRPLLDALLERDYTFVLADYASCGVSRSGDESVPRSGALVQHVDPQRRTLRFHLFRPPVLCRHLERVADRVACARCVQRTFRGREMRLRCPEYRANA